jgi:hypothetical protein
MMRQAKSARAIEKIKRSLAGMDANPTVWSLAMLNMFFRGDGKTSIAQGDSLSAKAVRNYEGAYSRSYLNPPFSQEEEPEYRFIDNATVALEPEGQLAAVVYAGVFADGDHENWRKAFLSRHRLLAMISLPDDLFYPTAAPTTIMVAEAHVPQKADDKVFMAKVWNDGFSKLKGRRISCAGSELPELERVYGKFVKNEGFRSKLATVVKGRELLNGEEWSPQKWLPQPPQDRETISDLMANASRSVLQAIAEFPEIADSVLTGFTDRWRALHPLPLNTKGKLSYFFEIKNGLSTGEKNYRGGDTPYVSSGDTANSIIALKSPETGEAFEDGGITVTAFGAASVQPWPFLARGNGGSSVRVLLPRFRMAEADLLWFAAQINAQRWRFFYARMAIKGRISHHEVVYPPHALNQNKKTNAQRVQSFSP